MKKFILVAVVAIVIVGLVFVFTGGPSQSPPSGPVGGPPGTAPQEPAPTGNVDDAVSAILKDIEGDLEPSVDASLLSESGQALNDFGRTLDGSQF